jgi:hypothetical protein
MTDKEAMKLAFEALVSINPEFVCNSAHKRKFFPVVGMPTWLTRR